MQSFLSPFGILKFGKSVKPSAIFGSIPLRVRVLTSLLRITDKPGVRRREAEHIGLYFCPVVDFFAIHEEQRYRWWGPKEMSAVRPFKKS